VLLQPRKLHDLSKTEALRRVASVGLGRLVYFARALPNVWPTTHLVDDDLIIVNAHAESELCRSLRNSPMNSVVIAYEVDVFDSKRHTGWCVVVTGPLSFLSASAIRNRVDLEKLRARLPDWADPQDIELLGISAEVVTGYELGSDNDYSELPDTA
jgi:hypothetical protein